MISASLPCMEFFPTTGLFPTCLLKLMCWIKADLCHRWLQWARPAAQILFSQKWEMPLFEELEHSQMQFLVPNESFWGLTWLYKICHQFSDPVMELLQDLQLHKELAFLPRLPWGQLLEHIRSGGIPDLPGTILFVTFPPVNGSFNSSADSPGGLCWSEQ